MIETQKQFFKSSAIDLPKHERIRRLIEILSNLDEKFNCPKQAHNHIEECLKITEKVFAPSKQKTMIIFDFHHFCFQGRSNIYYSCQLFNHAVLININGAYAIYRSKNEIRQSDYFNWNLYREKSTCLVQVKNLHLQSIWQNTYKTP